MKSRQACPTLALESMWCMFCGFAGMNSGMPASIDGIFVSKPSMRAYCGAASPAGCCHSDVGIFKPLLMNMTWASGLIIVGGGMGSSRIVPPGGALTFPGGWVYSGSEDPASEPREHPSPPTLRGGRKTPAGRHDDAGVLFRRRQEAGAGRFEDHLQRQGGEQAVSRAHAGVRCRGGAVPHHRRGAAPPLQTRHTEPPPGAHPRA